jgi:predicted transcriptional regulator
MSEPKPRSQKRHLPAVLSLRLTVDEVKALDELAAIMECSRGELARNAIRDYLDWPSPITGTQ